MSSTLEVEAPADLQEGYTFEAMTPEGQSFQASVPPGGVKQGQRFSVPHPGGSSVDASKSAMSSTMKPQMRGEPAPTGRWRYGLCECCDVFCKQLFWMACCCTSCSFGQLMQRMSLTWCSDPTDKQGSQNTCSTIALIAAAFFLVGVWIPFIDLIFLVFIVIVGTKARKHLRTKYDIPVQNCGDLEDCCCVFWCGCCTSIQMARHTHDEEEYPSKCCSGTGLGPDAPDV